MMNKLRVAERNASSSYTSHSQAQERKNNCCVLIKLHLSAALLDDMCYRSNELRQKSQLYLLHWQVSYMLNSQTGLFARKTSE